MESGRDFPIQCIKYPVIMLSCGLILQLFDHKAVSDLQDDHGTS